MGVFQAKACPGTCLDVFTTCFECFTHPAALFLLRPSVIQLLDSPLDLHVVVGALTETWRLPQIASR